MHNWQLTNLKLSYNYNARDVPVYVYFIYFCQIFRRILVLTR